MVPIAEFMPPVVASVDPSTIAALAATVTAISCDEPYALSI
jgi:hypothetical protein